MKPRPLWPLLPPVAALIFIVLFLVLTRWLGAQSSGCFLHQNTGLHCPGCGGTRCTNDLIAGNWLEALSHHALLTIGLVIFGALSLYFIVRVTILGKPAPALSSIAIPCLWIALGLLVLFTLLRNIPAWPFSLLAP